MIKTKIVNLSALISLGVVLVVLQFSHHGIQWYHLGVTLLVLVSALILNFFKRYTAGAIILTSGATFVAITGNLHTIILSW